MGEKLGLVSEQSPIPMANSKQVKEKKKANPRISCLDQLGDAKKMMVPALTLTEGTPTSKKFFKSGPPLIPSTPTRKAVSGAAGKVTGSKSKPVVKQSPAVGLLNCFESKQFKSPRSAKENSVWIYEDGAEETPSQAPLAEQTPATG